MCELAIKVQRTQYKTVMRVVTENDRTGHDKLLTRIGNSGWDLHVNSHGCRHNDRSQTDICMLNVSFSCIQWCFFGDI